MATVFKRLFNVRPEELPVFTAFFLFYLLIGVQFSIGLTVSEALFLAEVGPGFLPYMYIFNALVIIVVSGLYASYTDKLSVSSMFMVVLLFFVGLVLAIRILIGADVRALGMPIAFPLLHTLFTMFTNMIPNNFRAHYGLYLDVLQSKRMVPIILTGGRYGGIIGGLSIPILIPLLGSVANLLYVWVAAILASVGFIAYIDVRLRGQRLADGEGPPRKRGGAKGGRRREGTFALLRTNRYVAAFAAFSFIVVILRSFQDFQYSVVFREIFSDRAQLAAFLGYFTAIGSGVSLLVQTFITPLIIRRLGIGTANLIYPLTTLAGLAGMMVTPTFYSAVFLRFNNRNLQESIRNTINALLYNAVTPNVRGRVGAFVSGQVVAVASILSGVLLLIIKPTGLALFPLSPRWVAFISLLIGVAYLGVGFLLRQEYGASLRKMLQDRNLGLYQFAQEGFGPIDQESLAILTRNLREGDDELSLFAAGMLADTKDPKAVEAIREEIPRRRGRAACELLRVLARAPGMRESEPARALLGEFLASEDPERRCAAMDAIDKAGLIDEFAEQIQECLRLESPIVRVRAVQLLVRSDDLFWLASGLHTLHTMLEEGLTEERVCALRCVGELDNPRFIRRLVPYLYRPEAAVREAAAEAIERLLPVRGPQEPRLDEVMQVALADQHPSLRRRGVRLLGRRGARVDFERLLLALSDPDALVRYEAVSALKAIKRRGAISLEGGPLFSLLGRWIFAPRNGSAQELGTDQLVGGLIEFSLIHLREVYEIINHLHTIEQEGKREDFFMLRKVLLDKVQERQRLLLELLGVIGDEKTVETVSESLARGESSSRAIAIEALSNVSAVGTARQLILLLEPLLLGGSAGDKLAEGRKHWDLGTPTLNQVLRIYAGSNEPWVRAVAIDAAGYHLASGGGGRLSAEERAAWSVELKAVIRDENPYVREAGVAALGRMGGEADESRMTVQTALEDPDERVRSQARRALRRLGHEADGGGEAALSTIEKGLFLKGINMFESMTAEELRILSHISKEIRVPAGTILFKKGDPCDYLYVIVEGRVEIVDKPGGPDEELFAVLGPTTSFGEMALFGDQGRSAAARTAQDTTLLAVEKDPLLLLIEEHPSISIAIIIQLTSIIRHQDAVRLSPAPAES